MQMRDFEKADAGLWKSRRGTLEKQMRDFENADAGLLGNCYFINLGNKERFPEVTK